MDNSNAKKQWNQFRRHHGLWIVLFFWCAILWLEAIVRYTTCDVFFNSNLFFVVALSLPIAITTALLSSLGKEKTNRIIGGLLLGLFTLLFMIQIVYYSIFDAYFTLYSLTGTAEVAASFWKEAIFGLKKEIYPLLLASLPLILWLFTAKRIVLKKRISLNLALLFFFCASAIYLTVLVAIETDEEGVMSRGYLYSNSFVPQLTVSNFGVLTTYELDLKNLTLGNHSAAAKEKVTEKKENTVYNVLNIDFDSLIAKETDTVIKDMHQYFSTRTPTAQNEYTGKYKGKNIIWICAEGFSTWAIDKEKTPTLYKMVNEGYQFRNFYNPIWGVSTSDGEYTTCTGLIPKSGVWSLYKSGSNSMPFCLGNQLSALDYTTKAYHNHSYKYYHRDISHPNMGYDYEGYGNGLKVTYQWPESDVEMMDLTVPTYINDEKFHTYYMTVSGHLEYNFIGNQMAKKHEEDVSDLPYSSNCRAYIACQMEFDQAVSNLMKQLEAGGKLDDTLIVISGDHYPYGLTNEEIDELNGSYTERNFELYHSSLIIWDNAMAEEGENVIIDKVCSPIDILPTLSNLLGLSYDSRLLMGQDIFSDSEGLVVFADHSWLTEKGRYNAKTNTFTANKDTTITKNYAAEMMKKVNDMFSYSAAILDNDYYQKVLPDGITSEMTKKTTSQNTEEKKTEPTAEEKEEKAKEAKYRKIRSQIPLTTESAEKTPLKTDNK